MKLTEFLLKKPVTLFMIVWAILTIGIVSYGKLNVELMPDHSSPWLSVNVKYPNMSPSLIEEMIVKPLEEKISEIGGIKNLFSISEEGEGKVNIEFLPEMDIKKAAMYVRQKVELVRNNFPREANEPEVSHYNPSESPIFIITLSSKDLNYARNIAENSIKRKIERIEGVSSVIVRGGKMREVEINIDLSRLKAYQIGIEEVNQAIASSNIDLPLGKISVNQKETNVSFSGKIKTVPEFEKIGINLGKGKSIRLKDVAQIKDGSKEMDAIAKENGEEKISIYVQKASVSNTIQISEEIESVLRQMSLPNGISLNISYNQSVYIKQALHEVQFSGIIGLFMAMLIIFLFLRNIKDTLIIGISLPLAVLLTLSLMFLFKIHLNVMTLSALVLGIGMLVDNSIVVLDSIKTHQSDILDGLKAVKVPVAASALTNGIVFLPILFIDIQTRIMYGSFALVISLSLFSSFVVSIFMVPALFKNIHFKGFSNKKQALGFENKIIFKKIIQQFKLFQRKYQKFMIQIIKNKVKIMVSLICVLIICLFLLTRFNEKSSSFLDFNTITGSIHFNSGTTLLKALEITENLEKEINKLPYVKKITSKTEKEKTSLSIEIELEKLKGLSLEDIANILNEKYQKKKEATIRFIHGEESEQSNELTLEVFGDSLDEIKEKAKQMAQKAYQISGVDNVLLRFKEPKPEIQILADQEKLSAFFLNTKALGNSLKTYLRGGVASKYRDDEKEFDVTVKLRDQERKNAESIENLIILTPVKEFISLKSIAKIKENSTETKIYRKNKRRMASISIYYKNISQNQMIHELNTMIQKEKVSDDMVLQLDETYQEVKVRQKGIFFAVALSCLLVYMVLASLYESFLFPFLIISVVPMAFIGLILYLWAFNVSLSLSIYVGMVILIGITVNISILLLNQIRMNRKTMPMVISLFQACKSRSRPVFMTTLTTIFSLLPTALNYACGSEVWRSLAQTVIIGVVSGTILIFIIIPILCVFMEAKKSGS